MGSDKQFGPSGDPENVSYVERPKIAVRAGVVKVSYASSFAKLQFESLPETIEISKISGALLKIPRTKRER